MMDMETLWVIVRWVLAVPLAVLFIGAWFLIPSMLAGWWGKRANRRAYAEHEKDQEIERLRRQVDRLLR